MLHPSARNVTVPTDVGVQPMLRRRLVLVVVALFIPIVVMAGHRHTPVPVLAVVIAVVLSAAAISRIASAMQRDASLRAQLSHRATHDDLTGLPVRSVVLDRLLDVAQRRPRGVVAVHRPRPLQVRQRLDGSCDRRSTARRRSPSRLTIATPPEAFVARQSGDEFIVALPDSDVLGAGALAEIAAAQDLRPLPAHVRRSRDRGIDRHQPLQRPLAASSPPTCCARRTPRCTARRRAAATPRPCSTPRCTSACRVAVDLERASAPGARERRASRWHYQPIVDHPDGTHRRLRGAGALGARRRADLAGRVRAGRRGQRTDRARWAGSCSTRRAASSPGGAPTWSAPSDLYVSVNVSPRQMRVERLRRRRRRSARASPACRARRCGWRSPSAS